MNWGALSGYSKPNLLGALCGKAQNWVLCVAKHPINWGALSGKAPNKWGVLRGYLTELPIDSNDEIRNHTDL